MTEISFNTMPQAIENLISKIDMVEKILLSMVEETGERTTAPTDKWMNLDELVMYIPDHPSKSTIYNWVNKREIPYHKGGKRLRFRQSEIDGWLALGAHRTADELMNEANKFCKTRKIASL